ncbi:hypothetical protein SAY86_023380 [Trapa natans]|uniref:Dirigent protein n=1 Tax=Trapa natans TaxID=22666 RepID=A0AAN7LUX4_TRANT|nr:hypothetical protein SAY86_023380 [Trapa natans]
MAASFTSISLRLKALPFLLALVLTVAPAFSGRTLFEGDAQALPVAPAGAGQVQTPIGTGSVQSTIITGAAAPASSTAVGAGATTDPHALTFFMHDILGGSNPSARAVTGIVTNPAVSAQVPFAKPNGANLQINTGVPQGSANKGLINNNNIPFLTGLGGTTGNLIQNQNNNNGNFFGGTAGLPLLNDGQLPQGMTLQKMMFGTMTVFDDELTEGHELGSGLVGKAQGFYVASSEDGNSQTIAVTAMFQSGGYVDSISLYGVHRTVVSESQLAVMGGTGKYVNARGFATIKTFTGVNQQSTDGIETVAQFTVHLA